MPMVEFDYMREAPEEKSPRRLFGWLQVQEEVGRRDLIETVSNSVAETLMEEQQEKYERRGVSGLLLSFLRNLVFGALLRRN